MARALVIGASRGLGLGLVEELARKGWEVLATVRDPDAAGELKQLALGGKTRIETLDVTDPDSVRALRGLLDDERFDLLFLNAGIGNPRGKTALTVTDEEMQRLFATNALGPARTAAILAEVVREKTGVVAFMTSRLGSMGERSSDHAEPYSASKAALNSFIRSFAVRNAERKLTVLALHPGWVKTAIGGDGAPLEVEESVAGLVRVIEAERGSGRTAFLDYRGDEIAW